MARPKKDIRIKRNGDSLQLYEEGKYLGSYSLRELCQNLRGKKNSGTISILAQPEFINQEPES